MELAQDPVHWWLYTPSNCNKQGICSSAPALRITHGHDFVAMKFVTLSHIGLLLNYIATCIKGLTYSIRY